tara:strand:+ start:10823 stop:11836 length:1014 start_codon:yes stop_codon:yes gene_type:complete
MSYQRIGTPKVYVDYANYALTLGKIDSTDFTFASSGSVALSTSSNIMGMFDMKPSNLQQINSNTASDDLFITVDTHLSTDSEVDNNFVAILGHNLKQAGAKFQIEQSDNFSSNTYDVGNQTEIVNSAFSSGFHTPANNGWSLVTFSDRAGSNDNRLWRIRIEPSDVTYSANIQIGAILLGEVISLPHSPDLQLTRGFVFDGVNKQTSIGGQTYANANFLSGADWFLDPFNIDASRTTPNPIKKTGRQTWDINFSYLTDTDVFPETLYSVGGLVQGNDFYTNLINRTHGGMLPFLFQYDGTLTDGQDSFLWCRLNNEPQFKQVANRAWNTSINLIEEF